MERQDKHDDEICKNGGREECFGCCWQIPVKEGADIVDYDCGYY